MGNFSKVLCAGLPLWAAGAAMAQTSPLYISTGNGSGWWKLQGGNTQAQWQGNPPYCPAVTTSIKAFGGNAGDMGREYDLNGGDLGPNYQNNTGSSYFFDGGTDGVQYNYAINWAAGEVWRMDLNWQNGQFLFDTPDLTAGITYDTSTGTIWTNNGRLGGGNELRQYSTGGTLLNTYGYNVGADTMGLAYDAADDTFWIFNYSGGSTIYQFNDSGQNINSISTPFQYGIGAEFAVGIPAPGAGAPGPGRAGGGAPASGLIDFARARGREPARPIERRRPGRGREKRGCRPGEEESGERRPIKSLASPPGSLVRVGRARIPCERAGESPRGQFRVSAGRVVSARHLSGRESAIAEGEKDENEDALCFAGAAVASGAGGAGAAISLYTGEQIVNQQGLALLDGQYNGPAPLDDGGVRFNHTSGQLGSYPFLYPSGGDGSPVMYNCFGYGRTSMTRVDGQDFSAIELENGNGNGVNTQYLWITAYNNGSPVADFDLTTAPGDFWGVEGGGFDELRFGSYYQQGDRDQHNEGAYTCEMIDNVKYGLIPAPGAAALLGVGGLVAARRRRA